MSATPAAPCLLGASFATTASAHADRTAVTDLSAHSDGVTTTFGQLATRALRTAGFLHGLGVRRGDAVAALLPSCREWIEVLLAAAHLGALLVPLNTRYREQEIGHLLALSGARVLVTASDYEGVDLAARLHEVAVSPAGPDLPLAHVVNICGDATRLPVRWTVHDGAAMAVHDAPVPPPAAELDDPLIVFGTSGTTSAPKLAVHTHRTVTLQAAAVAERMAFGPGDPALQVLSLSGTFGFTPFLAGLLAGKPTVLLPIFKLDRVRAALAEHPAELLVAAEGSVRELLDALPDAGPLRRIVTAGIAIDDIVTAAGRLGITAMNVYGSSEVFAFAAVAEPDADAVTRTRAGGLLTAPGAQVRVTDPDTGAVLPIGEVGELQLRGDTVFPRYLHNPEATAAARTVDGWFRTGDSAVLLGDRTFHYLARSNDTLRLGGYSVSPADVETTIEALPGVRQAQVVGVRDARTGDDVGVAFVRPDTDEPVDEQDVLDHCRARLASFKVPRRVVIVDAYPTTPSANGDKIRRDRLRERAEKLITAGEHARSTTTGA